MKLRVKGNSIRYRLTKTEVSDLKTKGLVKETVDFGNNELVYILQITEKPELQAEFINCTLSIYMPQAMVNELADTNKVGFKAQHGKLSLLIEKDFACLDSVDEDQSDNYPNPLAGKI